jgi:hypothetical protein
VPSQTTIGTNHQHHNNHRRRRRRPEVVVDHNEKFLVEQIPGYATIHFGHHPHETTPLQQGSHTNIIFTYWYTDPTKSDVATRTCYT